MTTTNHISPMVSCAAEFRLTGRVQGFGIRPSVARLAIRIGICGYVQNTPAGVRIHAESPKPQELLRFDSELRDWCARQSDPIHVSRSDGSVAGYPSFVIRCSQETGCRSALIPRDTAICSRCLADVRRPGHRRTDYAFTSCTECGPRFSIIDGMPYERSATSMSVFPLCPACTAEMTSPDDRRFHAQTNACADCGPQLKARSPDDAVLANGADAVDQAAAVLRSGGIVAVLGIGGYQLICAAGDPATVLRLRERKQRPQKPLAVMIRDVSEIADALSVAEQKALTSPANPIVLIDRLQLHGIAAGVHDGMPGAGVFLPATALHDSLLQRSGRPLIVTSANIDSEPLLFDPDRDGPDLNRLADLIVDHDRRIAHPVDDSVVRVMGDRTVTIRCARGLAPLPLDVSTRRPVLAVGAHQKVAIAIASPDQAILGPHIGDLSGERSRERFVQCVEHLGRLYGISDYAIAHDLHPDYFTTRWAQEHASRTIPVQHHHAHIAAGMVEHGLLDREVLGMAFDGTGFGPDQTIWGGEFLIATATDYRRVAHLRQFALPGGDSAIRSPWKVAASLLTEIASDHHETVRRLVVSCEVPEADPGAVMSLARNSRTPRTSSLGRLFDGIAALVLGVGDLAFEGEAAMRLEAVCDSAEPGSYSFHTESRPDMLVLDWRPVVRSVLEDLDRGVPAGRIAMRFHRAVAVAANGIAERFPDLPIVAGGGCFQNRQLSDAIETACLHHPGGVFLPGQIPPNDGGIAAGQLAVAAAVIRQQKVV